MGLNLTNNEKLINRKYKLIIQPPSDIPSELEDYCLEEEFEYEYTY